MPVTTRPQDKFAFLFTGPTDSRYQKDLENVFTTLTEYYNYPAANIWVVWGGPDNLAVLFPGATPGNLVSINSDSDPKASFATLLTTFLGAVNANIPDTSVTGALNTALIYFTGSGLDADPVNPFDYAKLVLKPGTVDIAITSDELKTLFNSVTFAASQVNLVMQQDFANVFSNHFFPGGFYSLNKTVTFVYGDQSSAGNATNGGAFTMAWTEALHQETTVMDPSAKYADQLTVSTGTELFLVSLEQAKRFAELRNSPAIYGFSLNGEDSFLGKPIFYLEDGGSGAGWWESPSIYLTHPNATDPLKQNDLYVTDALAAVAPFNNTINVDVRNTGTHPVRVYRIGVRVFRTPMGGAADYIEQNGKMPVGAVLKPTNRISYNIFSNANKDTWIFNTPFYTGTTHECVKAKVVFAVADPVAEPFDWTWAITVNDNEAQRNTDQGSDPPVIRGRSVPGNSFRGAKKHLYQIVNPFNEQYTFRLVTTPEFEKALKYIDMTWYFIGKERKWTKLGFKKLEDMYSFADFNLLPGEAVDLMGEFGFKKDAGTKKIALPVELLVDRIEGKRTRKPLARSIEGKFSAIAGFTIRLVNEPGYLNITVFEKRGKPLAEAKVLIGTVNGMAEEALMTDKNGTIELKDINPDVYRLKALFKNRYSEEEIVELTSGEAMKVRLVVDGGKRG